MSTAKYIHRDDVEMTYAANRARVTLEIRLLMNRILNEALHELDVEFQEAIQRGDLIEVLPGQHVVRGLVRRATDRELGDGEG